MRLTQKELGRRLQGLRRNCRLTQERVAKELKVSRPTISQIESGYRAVSSIELLYLARLYSVDVAQLLSDKFSVEDAAYKGGLAVLFRAAPTIANDPAYRSSIESCYELFRAYTSIEQLLGLDKERELPVQYTPKDPANVWEVIRSGEQAAESERARLKLGIDPIGDIVEVIEPQAVRIAEVNLEESISGISMTDREIGFAIFVNKDHPDTRKRFSVAHEYCHVLFDRDKVSTVSSEANSKELSEVRANAFAAAFLMPEAGVHQFMRSLGKGYVSRESLYSFSESGGEPAFGEHRSLAFYHQLNFYDVLRLQFHFGSSYEATLYRLKNLKLISESEFERLRKLSGHVKDIAKVLKLKWESKNGGIKTSFMYSFLGMAIEAYRRDEITLSKLIELANLVDISQKSLKRILKKVGLLEEVEKEAYYPDKE